MEVTGDKGHKKWNSNDDNDKVDIFEWFLFINKGTIMPSQKVTNSLSLINGNKWILWNILENSGV